MNVNLLKKVCFYKKITKKPAKAGIFIFVEKNTLFHVKLLITL